MVNLKEKDLNLTDHQEVYSLFYLINVIYIFLKKFKKYCMKTVLDTDKQEIVQFFEFFPNMEEELLNEENRKLKNFEIKVYYFFVFSLSSTNG